MREYNFTAIADDTVTRFYLSLRREPLTELPREKRDGKSPFDPFDESTPVLPRRQAS
jgi:hypothetical protein